MTALTINHLPSRYLLMFHPGPGYDDDHIVPCGYGESADGCLQHGMSAALTFAADLGVGGLLYSSVQPVSQPDMTDDDWEKLCQIIDDTHTEMGCNREPEQ